MNLEYLLKKIFTGYVIPSLDILFIAFIIFYVYLFIEKTKASNLAKGLLIVFFAFVLLELLDFPIFSWFFSKIIANIVLVIIVLFSPEIRSLLISLGKKQAFRKISKEEMENINIIASACSNLSLKKIGALIVLQRKTDLKQIVTNYIPMDATISEEIFFFIFDKKSIIHDGAVIIKDKRFLCVSAILPLSETELPEKHMGTRHRAALGVTEESDAISIVVSEETGRISLCENGQMFINLSELELKRRLKGILYIQDGEENLLDEAKEDNRE